MSILGNDLLLGSGDEGYNLTRSLRFRSSASAYLSRTMGTPTNNKIFTVSFWVKRGLLSSRQGLIGATNSGASNYWMVEFDAGNNLTIYDAYASGTTALTTTQVFRDPSAWYHVVAAVDTTQATASNRTKVYVNGSQVTSFSVSNYPSQNSNTYFNTSGAVASVGSWNPFSTPYYFDGYLTEVNFIDGQALTPSSFGETDTITGVWKPKRFAGTYGTNGFYLPFTDNSALTTSSNAGLGKDFSGNGNYWTTNNISITSGTTYDSMTDVPTLTSATAANYCTWNPLSGTSGTLSEGNLFYAGPSGYGSRMGTVALPTNGKTYFEVTLTSGPYSPRSSATSYNWIGVAKTTNFNTTASPSNSNVNGLMIGDNGYINNFASSSSDTGTTFVVNDVIGIAIDTNANTYTIYKNNSSIASGTINITAGSSLSPMHISYDSSNGAMKANFGQRPFTYTPPTGYVALNTYNLPTSTIVKGNTVMDATLYTGNGSTQSIVNAAGFKPDLVWVKSRSAATSNTLYDSVRGTTKYIISNSDVAEATDANTLTAFNSNGFALGSTAAVNANAATFVGWQWQAGQGTTSTNTSGSITSTVSVNATAGFSVVTYTGTGANATVGHGLGVAPSMILSKSRNNGSGDSGFWDVYHVGLTSAAYFLKLNTTDAQASASTVWNSTAPTSSVYSIGTASGTNAGSGATYVAYCFAPIAGYSAFGSYTGNGSADGPFTYTGFRPRWVLIKASSTTSQWVLWDTARNTYNVTNSILYPNLSAVEASFSIDILSNGFKFREAGGAGNDSGVTYIYAAFAENPFKNALAR